MANAADVLRQSDVFGGLPEAELRRIARLAKERRYRAEEVLFRQGETADALYVITQGRVKIAARDPGGREKVLAFSGAGEVLGEMGVLTGEPRSATAVASTDCVVLRLAKQDFDVLLSAHAPIMRELLRVVTRRRDTSHQRAFEEANVTRGVQHGLVTLVFSPRGGAGVTTIATNLAVALAQRTPDRIALVDLDVLFGHTALLLNLTPRTSLAAISVHALQQIDRESFDSYLSTHRESSLRVLSGTLRPEDAERVTSDHVRTSFELLRRVFGHVVVDTGRNFSEVTLAAVELADELLLVSTPELVGVRAVRDSRRIFGDVLGIPRERMKCVLNAPSSFRSLTSRQVEDALGVPIWLELPFGGDTPTRAALEGYPMISRWPQSPVSKALLDLAARLETSAREAVALAAG